MTEVLGRGQWNDPKTDLPHCLAEHADDRLGAAALPSNPITQVLELRAVGYRARISTRGATLMGLWKGPTAVTLPGADDVAPRASSGQVLLPWPNRVRDGRYSWEDEIHQLTITEPANHNAIHGLLVEAEWQLSRADACVAVLSTRIALQPGYPFAVDAQIRYGLSDQGLRVCISARNLSDRPAPIGIGFHPYLDAGGSVDGLTVSFPSSVVVGVDERGLPTTHQPTAGGSFDFNRARRLADARIDNPFPTDGPWTASIVRPDGIGIQLSSDAPWLQVYTGEATGRVGIAVEPMTCPPDAFNTMPSAVAVDPGGLRALCCQIAATNPQEV